MLTSCMEYLGDMICAMAKLTAKRRNRLKRSQFASPKGQAPDKNRNQYSIDTRKRAANAKARATQMARKGKISRSKAKQIHARANKVLKRKS